MGRRRIGEEICCEECKTLTRNKRYCCEQCQYTAYRRKEVELGNRVSFVCAKCGETFQRQRSDSKIHLNIRYCSRLCKDEHQKSLYVGEGNPLFGRVASTDTLYLRKCRAMFNSAKARSKRKGLEFNLTLEDIKIPLTCPLLNISLFTGEGKVCSNSPSLDRIDPNKGYVRGNVQVISYRANTIKQDASIEELILITNRLCEIWQK